MNTLENFPAGALPSSRFDAWAPELSAAVARASGAEVDRLACARDMWTLGLLWARQGKVPRPPEAVVWPTSEGELVALIAWARKTRVPLTPFGAGSGVCGGTWAVKGGVAVDLKAFDTIGAVDPQARSVEVGAGVLGETLERTLNAQGYTLGHFPSSIYMSTVGGWLAARSAGQLSSRYGKIEDMVLSLRAVSGAGEPIATAERPFRGPDIAQLLIGSEGTLCVFTQAKLRVFPQPALRAFRALELPNLISGLDAIRNIFHAGLRPAVVRLYDPFDTALVGKTKPSPHGPGPLRDWLASPLLGPTLRRAAAETLGRPGWLNRASSLFQKSRMILMFEGESSRAQAELEQALAVCAQHRSRDLGEAPAKHWYETRYDVSFRMSPIIAAGGFADTFEVACRWEQVSDVYERVKAAVAPHAFVMCHFSHAYVEGCSLYFTFVASADSEEALAERYGSTWRNALAAATSAGANVSHHHGIGLLKSQALQETLGESRHALRRLKEHFDPDGIMNPGKLGL